MTTNQIKPINLRIISEIMHDGAIVHPRTNHIADRLFSINNINFKFHAYANGESSK